MAKRTVLYFWGALAAATFFLGSAWAAAGNLSGPHAPLNAGVLAVAASGLLGTVLVAGRIAVVVGQALRDGRQRRSESVG